MIKVLRSSTGFQIQHYTMRIVGSIACDGCTEGSYDRKFYQRCYVANLGFLICVRIRLKLISNPVLQSSLVKLYHP